MTPVPASTVLEPSLWPKTAHQQACTGHVGSTPHPPAVSSSPGPSQAVQPAMQDLPSPISGPVAALRPLGRTANHMEAYLTLQQPQPLHKVGPCSQQGQGPTPPTACPSSYLPANRRVHAAHTEGTHRVNSSSDKRGVCYWTS